MELLNSDIWHQEGNSFVMRADVAVEYRKAIRVQLDLWLKGVSVHTKPPEGVEPECCPDFSCCFPELLVPIHERQAYMERFYFKPN